MNEEQIRRIVRQEMSKMLTMFGGERILIDKDIKLYDGRNIQLGETNGTMIGTSTTQKLGFFGSDPVEQQPAVSDPSGGGTVDSQARTAIIAIKSELENYGLLDTP